MIKKLELYTAVRPSRRLIVLSGASVPIYITKDMLKKGFAPRC
jgi:hypothetical protein